jgi:KDO2-lipid IV(A) lauroyltransferase
VNESTPEIETGFRAALEPKLMGAFATAFEKMDLTACRYAGGWLGLGLYSALGKRRSTAVQNARLAFGVSEARANQIARRSCLNFGMTFAEFLHMREANESEIRSYCSVEGFEHVQEGFKSGNGVILLTAHIGNWEMMGARAAQEFPLTVIARPTSNGGVQNFIDQSRAAHGVKVISKFKSGREPFRVLKENQALGILPDQHAGVDGELLPFFGQPTRVWGALARLALISGATVVPAFGVRRYPFLADGRIIAKVSKGWKVEKGADKNAAITEGTKRVISELETVVKNHPDQWLWLHRRWREKDGAVFPS